MYPRFSFVAGAISLLVSCTITGASVAAFSFANKSGGVDTISFVKIDEIIVPIIESDRIDGALRFKLVLDAANPEAALRLKEITPQLRAVTISSAIEFARIYASGVAAVDVAQLTDDLTSALKSADPGVARVLVVEAVATRA